MNFLKRMRIRTQMLVLAASALIVVILIFFVTYMMFENIIKKNNDQYNEDMFMQIEQNISSNYDLFNRILTNIAYNNSVQKYLTVEDPIQRIDYFRDANNVLLNARSMKNGIVDIIIHSDSGNSLYLKGEKASTRSMMESFKGRLIHYYTGAKQIEYSSKETCYCFIASLTVYSVDTFANPGKRIGVAAIVIDAATLGLYTSSKSEKATATLFLLDRDNRVYSSNDPTSIGSVFEQIKGIEGIGNVNKMMKINGETNWVKVERIPEIGGTIVSIVPKRELFSDLTGTLKKISLLFIVSLILLSVPYILIARNIVTPLSRLMRFMSEIKSGSLKGFKKRVQVEGYREMSAMSREFNAMLDEIDSLTDRLIDSNTQFYKIKLEKKQSELAFLQSQINPHFLYNTLDSIRGIAAVKGVKEIRDLTGSLSQIFKYSISGDETVPLREELGIVESFIMIQQIRFAGRFSVKYDFEPEAMNCRILKMILQPIVENATYHGLEMKSDKGLLTIGARLTDEGLRIWIEDDGIGMDRSRLEALIQKLRWNEDGDQSAPIPKGSIGLANVNNRIKLTYGQAYGIRISSVLGEGTRVEVVLPAKEDEDVYRDDR